MLRLFLEPFGYSPFFPVAVQKEAGEKANSDNDEQRAESKLDP